ncbi:MAG: YfcC family protein [Ruminococcaceae bacterium]|nr:YfcC family protein [Oscillospiraceae bacterium]
MNQNDIMIDNQAEQLVDSGENTPAGTKGKAGLHISTKTFISTVIVLLAVMLCAGILTQVIPVSSYDRIVTAEGYEEVDITSYTVHEDAPRLPFWRTFTAPVEVLGSEDGLVAIMIILFILFVGGSFMILDKSGVMQHIITSAVSRFGKRKYLLMAVMVLVGMTLGSVCGMFEECAALVPIVVAVALALGWDSFVGLGMSIIAVCFGFAAGTFNPFSIAVAQRLAGLPLYSGIGLRIAVFFICYIILITYLLLYARRVEKNPQRSLSYESDLLLREKYSYSFDSTVPVDPNVRRASFIFIGAFVLVAIYIALSLTVKLPEDAAFQLSDLTMPVMIILLTAAGIAVGFVSKYSKTVIGDFLKGMLSIAPCGLLVVMAMSAKQIVVAGGVMDTILHWAYGMMTDVNPYVAILMIYLFVLLLEFFVSSASAKAFIVIPLVVPLVGMLAQSGGAEITRQTVVQAYCFGDGFTNMFMPTNAALFIVLGLVNISYGKWVRWALPLQLVTLAVTSAILMFCVYIGYN